MYRLFYKTQAGHIRTHSLYSRDFRSVYCLNIKKIICYTWSSLGGLQASPFRNTRARGNNQRFASFNGRKKKKKIEIVWLCFHLPEVSLTNAALLRTRIGHCALTVEVRSRVEASEVSTARILSLPVLMIIISFRLSIYGDHVSLAGP